MQKRRKRILLLKTQTHWKKKGAQKISDVRPKDIFLRYEHKFALNTVKIKKHSRHLGAQIVSFLRRCVKQMSNNFFPWGAREILHNGAKSLKKSLRGRLQKTHQFRQISTINVRYIVVRHVHFSQIHLIYIEYWETWKIRIGNVQ